MIRHEHLQPFAEGRIEMIDSTEIESDAIPDAWSEAFRYQTLDPPFAPEGERFHIMARGLPDTVPDTVAHTLLETMAWSLAMSSGFDLILQPLHTKIGGTGPKKILPCGPDQAARITERGFIGLMRHDFRQSLPVGAECFEHLPKACRRKAVLAVSEPLFIRSSAPAPRSIQDHRVTLRHDLAELARKKLPTSWKIRMKRRWEDAQKRLRAARSFRQPSEPSLAKRKTWTPAIFRARLPVTVPEVRDRIPVLMAIHWLELGGAEKFAVDLIKALPKDCYAVYVTTEMPSKNPWADDIRPHVEEILHLPEFLPKKEASAFYDHYIRSRRIRLMHIHHAPLAYDALFFLRRFHPDLKILDTLHILELPPHSGGYPEHSAHNAEPFIDRHHVASRHLKQFLIERWHVPESKIDAIHLNVDTAYFDPETVAAGTVRRKHKIPADACLVGFVGRMVRQKRPMAFVELAEMLMAKARENGNPPPLHFIMAGGGYMKDALQRAVNQKGLTACFHFHGEVTDTRPVYRDLDLLVMPSENEGLALVTYEAMAMELPIVFTDVGAQSELLPPEFLVPDAEPLAPSLARAAWPLIVDQERRRKTGKDFRRRILKNHRAEQTFERMLSVYDFFLKKW